LEKKDNHQKSVRFAHPVAAEGSSTRLQKCTDVPKWKDLKPLQPKGLRCNRLEDDLDKLASYTKTVPKRDIEYQLETNSGYSKACAEENRYPKGNVQCGLCLPGYKLLSNDQCVQACKEDSWRPETTSPAPDSDLGSNGSGSWFGILAVVIVLGGAGGGAWFMLQKRKGAKSREVEDEKGEVEMQSWQPQDACGAAGAGYSVSTQQSYQQTVVWYDTQQTQSYPVDPQQGGYAYSAYSGTGDLGYGVPLDPRLASNSSSGFTF